jgi:hypothetical protein
MPLARIDLAEGNPANYRRAFGDLRFQRPCGARVAAGGYRIVRFIQMESS